MKKIFFLATAFCLAGIASKAQTQKGYYLIGGNIGKIGGTFQGGGSEFNFNLSPKAAWFIQDRLAVGGMVELDLRTIKGGGTSVDYAVGPLARYYFSKSEVGELVRKTTFFAEANAGIGGRNVSSGGGSTNGFVAGVGPGLAYFINENIALEALAKLDLKTGFGSSAAAFSPNIGVGFQIYLPSSKLKSIRNDVK